MPENISSSTGSLIALAQFRYELRSFLSFSEKISEQEGVSAQQYQLLQVIATVPNGSEASISFVSERMLLRHNSAVELVDRAARCGLVKRKSDPADLRRSLVELTVRGAKVLARLVPAHLAELEAYAGRIMRAMESLLAQKKEKQIATQEKDSETAAPISACSL